MSDACTKCGKPVETPDDEHCPLCRISVTKLMSELASSEEDKTAKVFPEDVPPSVNAAMADSGNAFGRYIRVSLLGRGGMGEVWKAWDKDLGRWVALKFPKYEDSQDLDRFQKEAGAMARFSHPNLAAVYEFGQAQGRHFIAMQYVNGDTLARHPRNNRRMLVGFIHDAARALDSAHQAGFTHRDIKPENIMVDANSRHVYVMDFGLARKTATPRSTTSIVGTPHYMSPEQAQGLDIDGRSDVYSLGATLYELLAGHPPFEGSQVLEVLNKVVEEEPASLRLKDSGIDIDLDTVIFKCLEKDPQSRYATAGELAEDLQRWLDGDAVLARRSSWMGKVVRRIRRRPVMFGLAGGLLLSVGVILAVMSSLGKVSDELLRFKQASELSRAYDEIFRKLEPEFRRAEAIIFDGPPAEEGEPKKILDRVDTVLREAPEFLAATTLPEAIRSWIHYCLGDQHEAIQRIERAVESGGLESNDPFAVLYRARIMALGLLKWFGHLQISVTNQGLEVRNIGLDEYYRGVLQEVKKLILPLVDWAGWKEMRESRQYGDFIRGLVALAREEYDQAAERFESVAWATDIGAEAIYYAGLSRLLEGKPDAAVAPLLKCTSQRPDWVLTWIYLGVARLSLAEGLARVVKPNTTAVYDDSIAALDEAIRVRPDHQQAYRFRALAHSRKASFLSRTGKDALPAFALALSDYDSAIRLAPKNLESLRNRAVTHIRLAATPGVDDVKEREHLDKAIADVEAVLDRLPEDAISLHTLGVAWQALARNTWRGGGDPSIEFRKAIESLEDAIRRNPDKAMSYTVLGDTQLTFSDYLMRNGREVESLLRDARDNLEQALSIDGTDGSTHKNMGLYFRLEAERKFFLKEDSRPEWRSSIEHLERSRELDPSRASTLRHLAYSWRAYGDMQAMRKLNARESWQKALEAADKAIRINDKDIESYNSRGTAMHRLGMNDFMQNRDGTRMLKKALENYDTALGLDPKSWKSMVGKADILEGLRRYKEAVVVLEEAYRLSGKRLPVIKKRLDRMKQLAGDD